MSENAIEVRNLKKIFKIYPDKSNSIKEKILFFKRNKYEVNQVLDGVSFDIKKGEAVGLIGKNGCGKSTTLKLLNRIMYPTSGTIRVNGRVSSLIELGAGFHPDMSGRENIYTNASIFGLTKKQIDEKLDDIIEFSELGEAVDNPVRTYSSGMYMRLAFSVAINVEADVLLIDEILAVGDVSFQKKCFEKLREIKYSGTTIVIVSHSLQQIEQICDKSIWIEKGHIRQIGNPKEIHLKYLKEMELQLTGITEEQVIEVGKIYGYSKAITGKITSANSTFDYDIETGSGNIYANVDLILQIVDVETTKILYSSKISGSTYYTITKYPSMALREAALDSACNDLAIQVESKMRNIFKVILKISDMKDGNAILFAGSEHGINKNTRFDYQNIPFYDTITIKVLQI